ncbi:FkbM family methyltransferase [Frankia sp. CNm7]|uniref:FkbM family methyltransferase n=1 Tax=Frankia nepalensis TaxID=1836974 RepID=A0A937RVH2_9ACTN|nr:FkbM family methyltransferase [Frankia nepalensis]MBL7501942.1 FkbM family methyltransferase [Frankia nepalensis]MBL7516336.1 FkbM family methyltransferase [Frankia nepalensis]MBL7519690.1 FkbM family methyltransferase [Frankia nepalensis]MBL7633578.1 FkbM family methyltransferase [Frankia nepalensis]
MSKANPRWVARNVVRRVPAANARMPLKAWASLWGGAGGPGIDAISLVKRIADQAGHPLTVVQIGANDGEMGDPLHEVIVDYGWRGVLVEPMPHLFAALRTSYRDAPGIVCERAAIGDRDGTATMYTAAWRPGDPLWAIGLSSLRREIIEDAAQLIPDIIDRIEEVEVPVMRLETLLTKHGINHIDLLQIDAEGFDFEILKQIDFSRTWAPWHLIYEARHLGESLAEAHRMLEAAGYTLFPAGDDDYAYRF